MSDAGYFDVVRVRCDLCGEPAHFSPVDGGGPRNMDLKCDGLEGCGQVLRVTLRPHGDYRLI